MDTWALYSAISKFALYVGALGATGLCLCAVVFAKHISLAAHRHRISSLAVAGLVASVASYLLRGASLVGDWSGAVDPEILGILWETPVGTALALRLVGFTLILAGMVFLRRGLWLAIVGGGLTVWSFAQIGHIADKPGVLLGLVLGVHLGIAALWIGVLTPLRSLAMRPDTQAQAADLGHRFGQVAAWLIPMLVVAGMYMTWQLVGGPAGLVTPYGLVLLAKLGCVAGLLGLGAANKLRFVPALRSGDPSAGQHLSRSIALEWGLIFLILAATAWLTTSFSPLV